MSLETVFVVLAVLAGMALLAWVYCAIFDFVDAWKKKARLREREDAWTAAAREVIGRAKVRTGGEARLPPMAPIAPEFQSAFNHEPPTGPPERGSH